MFPGERFEAQEALLRAAGISRPTIFDVGANRGQTAAKYRAIFPEAKIYSFEPYPKSFAELERRFGDDQAFKAVPLAATEATGMFELHVSSSDTTNSLLPRLESKRRYLHSSATPKGVITVSTTSLDDFVRSEGIEQVDILKIDVEGGELPALRGARQILEIGRTSCIVLEAQFVPMFEGSPLFHRLWKHLEGFGYTLFGIYDLHWAINGQLKYGDSLFISEHVREEVVDRYDSEP
jgi:FkbM family methyltransferase